MKRFIFILLLTLFCSFVHAQNNNIRILILHSYHPDFPWTAGIDSAATEVLIRHYPNVSIQKEYFDTKRWDTEKVEPVFYEYMKKKYDGIDFDIILSTDDNALNFLLERRDELFPDTPYIFCGINYIDLYDLSGEKNLTGISEDYDIPANLDLIRSLPLNIKNIAVVTDSTTSGKAALVRFKNESLTYQSYFNFIELSDLSIEELSQQLKNLPENSAVLNLTFWRDRNDVAFEPATIMPILSEASGVPVFGAWDYFIVGGTFGGIVTSSALHGRLLAETAVRILEGTPADEIQIHREKTTEPYFDYEVLKSFGIKKSNLPDNSVILNPPDTLFYRNSKLYWFILSVIATLTILVIFLALNIHRRKQSELLFKSLFNHIPDIVVVHSRKGRILQKNLTATDNTDFMVKTLREFNNSWEKNFPYVITNSKQTPPFVKEEITYQSSAKNDASTAFRHFEMNSVQIMYKGKPEILSIFRDITSRKNYEFELKESIAEKNILLQEVHHRVKNNLQIISSLLALQASSIRDKKAVTALIDSERRIMTMAQAHEKIYQSTTLSIINLNSYISSLSELFASQGHTDLLVDTECDDITVSIDIAVPLGLILNELFSNSIKYAFMDSEKPEINIICKTAEEQMLEFTFRDSGPGFNFDKNKHTSLGLKLVTALIIQLNAEVSYSRQRGSEYLFKIPI